MREQLSNVSGWIPRRAAIVMLLLGAGAIGAALAIDGGGDPPSRFEQIAERSNESGNKQGGTPEEHGATPEDRGGTPEGFGDGFGEGFSGPDRRPGPDGFRHHDGFDRLPENFGDVGEAVEGLASCLEGEGLEPFEGFRGPLGPRSRGEFGPGLRDFSPNSDHSPESGVQSQSRGAGESFFGSHVPGFGRGGDFDFDALQQAFEACRDQLPEEFQEPFDRGQEHFGERQQHRGALEECLQGEGIGSEDRPERGQLPDEADLERLRDAFERCRGELGSPFDGAPDEPGAQPEER